jgi:hypothetical protein
VRLGYHDARHNHPAHAASLIGDALGLALWNGLRQLQLATRTWLVMSTSRSSAPTLRSADVPRALDVSGHSQLASSAAGQWGRPALANRPIRTTSSGSRGSRPAWRCVARRARRAADIGALVRGSVRGTVLTMLWAPSLDEARQRAPRRGGALALAR